ncbi:MAG: 16S rRNA (guanine(527)-N(7))-methyltransferase RsmG [Coriobacteriia bacterium]|nr:16S rRNA (guanine(527)-N(7))-methyltransferase RsmG [Coriobacteriia bacterium]
MKHNLSYTALGSRDVEDALSALGLSVSSEQIGLLVRHANLVLEANTRLNLTRIVEPHAVATLHIADSLAFTTHATLGGRILDIGAGAGFPGIPLAIIGHDVWLCESVTKKASFLSTCLADLGLHGKVFDIRAEELASTHPAAVDVVVARAVSSLPSLVELAAPLLVPGGRLVALKGSPEDSERAAGVAAAGICGLVLSSEIHYSLPAGESRAVFVYERVGRSRVKLPRSPGMAQRHPLARIEA